MTPCTHCQRDTQNPKFCSSSCAASYNNKRTHTEESKRKTSASLKRAITEGRATPPTNNQRGKSWRKASDSNWLQYKQSCSFYTPHWLLPLIEGHELVSSIGWYDPETNLDGASRDHLLSVSEGWKRSIPPEIIRHPANCKIIPMHENRRKGRRSSITYEELLSRIDSWGAW